MPPTQQKHPWRAALRTGVVSLVALIPILPEIIRASGWDAVPWIASISGLAAALTRILSTPSFVRWSRQYAPWLAPDSYHGKHRNEDCSQFPDADRDGGEVPRG